MTITLNLTQEKLGAWEPTAAQIELAELMFAAMAHEEAVAAIVFPYQRAILEKGQWRVAKERQVRGRGPDVVLAPDDVWLIESDARKEYRRLCDEARQQAGLSVRHSRGCPLIEAEEAARDAKFYFVVSAAPSFGIPEERVEAVPQWDYQHALRIFSDLIAPHVDAKRALNRIIGPEPAESATQS